MNGISIRILEVCREKHSCFFRPLKHLMTELSYNMFLLLPFAETGWKKPGFLSAAGGAVRKAHLLILRFLEEKVTDLSAETWLKI